MSKRWTAAALALGLMAPVAMVGCTEDNKTKTTVEQKGPEGTTKETVTRETEQSGDLPPAPTGVSGEPGAKTP